MKPTTRNKHAARQEHAAGVLKTRTLTDLYNARGAPDGTWLDKVHRNIAATYGWPTGRSGDEILRRLLALSHQRAGKAT
jgi:hypothetical protein